MNNRKIIKVIGNLLVLLSLAFIIDKLIQYNIDFHSFLAVRSLIVIGTCIMVYSILVVTHAYMFYTILASIHRTPLSKGNAINTFCKTNLYKYLPGNVFHYIGRNQIAIDEQISHSIVLTATIMDTSLLIISAVAVAFAFAGHYALIWFMHISYGHWLCTITILLTAAGILAIMLHRFRKTINTPIAEVKRMAPQVAFKLIGVYMVVFIVNGLILSWVLDITGVNISPKTFVFMIIGMYALSWVIGFVTPGAPAGLGVREAVMSLFLTGFARTDLVVTAVVVTRIITTLGDVMGFLIARRFWLPTNRERRLDLRDEGCNHCHYGS